MTGHSDIGEGEYQAWPTHGGPEGESPRSRGVKLTPSKVARIAACPGSIAATAGIKDESSPAAQEGERLHAVMAGGGRVGLTDEQRDVIQACADAGTDLLAKYLPAGMTRGPKRETFTRAALPGGAVISAKEDWLGADDARALVIDWKFGRGDVDPADENLQMRAYAVAVAKSERVEEVAVAVVAPRAFGPPVTDCLYLPEDIAAAEAELVRIANRAAAPDAPRIPGPTQCKYCPALGTSRCPESAAMAEALIPVDQASILPTGKELAALLDRGAQVSMLVDRLRDQARAELEAGRDVPGWKLTAGRKMRRITDAQAAFTKLAVVLTAEQFAATCSVRVVALEAALRETLGWTAGETKARLADLLGDAMDEETSRPSLRRE